MIRILRWAAKSLGVVLGCWAMVSIPLAVAGVVAIAIGGALGVDYVGTFGIALGSPLLSGALGILRAIRALIGFIASGPAGYLVGALIWAAAIAACQADPPMGTSRRER